jgi:proline dehydrogenase
MDIMKCKNISSNDTRIWFGQLYGMSDNISFNLAKRNYNVFKILPFGSVKNLMPYLIRRAEENTSVSGQTGRELQLIQNEKNRRSKLKA